MARPDSFFGTLKVPTVPRLERAEGPRGPWWAGDYTPGGGPGVEYSHPVGCEGERLQLDCSVPDRLLRPLKRPSRAARRRLSCAGMNVDRGGGTTPRVQRHP
jgi:hypothetical protein